MEYIKGVWWSRQYVIHILNPNYTSSSEKEEVY